MNAENTLSDIHLKLDALAKEVKNIHKFVKKIERDSQDPTGEKKLERQKNSVYNRPCRLTSQIANFCGVPHDVQMTRKEVGAIVNSYVKHKNLAEGIEIRPDERLTALLAPSDKQLTYLTIGSRIKHHFLPISTEE